MVSLEYLIIYTDDGLPIYSRCFGNQCKRSMRNDLLFSAFLSALSSFALVSEEKLPQEMKLEDEMIRISYDENKKINVILLEDLELIFYYTRFENITIAAGFTEKDAKIWKSKNMLDIFLKNIEKFLEGYMDINWSNVNNNVLLDFEMHLLDETITPFFKKFDIKNKCSMGDNCPYRLAMYEGRGVTIYEKLGHKVREIAKSSILKKLMLIIMPSKYKLKRRSTIRLMNANQ